AGAGRRQAGTRGARTRPGAGHRPSERAVPAPRTPPRPGSGRPSFLAASLACLVSNAIVGVDARPGEEDDRDPLQECAQVTARLELHAPAGGARGEAAI